jgi:hypothetical protein
MDLLILIGITAFFGLAALSMIGQRNASQAAQLIVVRADQLKEREGDHGSAGFGIFLLFAVIAGAVFFL